MKNLDFEWLTDEFMLYCRSTQLREKTMSSYEQTLHLFGRWLADELKIYTVDKISENVIRKYIDDLMVRGKYTFYVNDLSKKKNCQTAEETTANLSALPPSTITSATSECSLTGWSGSTSSVRIP